MKKKLLLSVIIVLVTVIIIALIVIFYPVIKNNHYQNKLKEDIYENTSITNITYLNKDNNYYIVKTDEKVIVLDLNYDEVYSINISELIDSNFDLTYRLNNLYYKEKIREKDKLTYNFYDVKNLELVYTSRVGGA
ncbi:MAG: hypothetical protein ACI31S_06560 [Bacilli bacterium]